MMKSTRAILFVFLLVFSGKSFAQLDVFHVLGRAGKSYEPGYGIGTFLKVSVAASKANEVTLEGGFNTFDGGDAGSAFVKLGYLHTLDRSGNGFYTEPQLGYSFFGLRDDPVLSSVNNKVTKSMVGPMATLNIGYRTKGRLTVDIAARVETVINKEGVFGLAGLRLAVPIRFGRNRF